MTLKQRRQAVAIVGLRFDTFAAYLSCLGTVVWDGPLPEPRVFQSISGRDSLLRIIDEDLCKEV